MIEVAPRLFVGNQLDYEKRVKPVTAGWFVVQACKEPYHREALGYKGMAGPREHHEYLFAYRDNRMILNMVDAPKPEFFKPELIEAALRFIHDGLENFADMKVLVHCNQGGSRAPALALLYLRRHSERFEALSFDDAEKVFLNIYPPYAPAAGIRAYVRQNWDQVDAGKSQDCTAIAGP